LARSRYPQLVPRTEQAVADRDHPRPAARQFRGDCPRQQSLATFLRLARERPRTAAPTGGRTGALLSNQKSLSEMARAPDALGTVFGGCHSLPTKLRNPWQ